MPSLGEMARNSCSLSKISIWWDIENCHVPKNVDPHYIAQNLRSALHHANLNGPVTIDVFADTRNLEHRILEALSSTGINVTHIPSGNKDAADKAILVAMLFWALDNPPPAHFLLISGDGDFANALHRLRLKGYNILLARPDQPVKPALLGAATSVWYWTNVAKGQIHKPEEERRAHEFSSGNHSRASGASADEDAQNTSHRITPVQESDCPGTLASSNFPRTIYADKHETNCCFLGEQHPSNCERDKWPMIPMHSRVIEEDVKLNGDVTQLESNLQPRKEKVAFHAPISNSVIPNKQLYNPGQKMMQSGLGSSHFTKQSHDGHVFSNMITDFNTKGPPGISSSLSTVTGHYAGPFQDTQRAHNNLNIPRLMETFKRLRLDGLAPTQENLQHCFSYWEKQNGMVNIKELLDQALNLGHVEKVFIEKGGYTVFLPIKTELWKCYNVHDTQYAFSEIQLKNFHQFLCCSKNWQFFLHSQSLYEAAQRLQRDGPIGVRDLAVGEIIHFLNQAIWKWKWLSLENKPQFLLTIRSQAIFTQKPTEEPIKMQPDKDVPMKVVSRESTSSVNDTPAKQFILKELRCWLKETASIRHNYDISLVPKDFEHATGIHLDLQKLGFAKLQELLEEFRDVVRMQVVRKGLKVLCPAAAASQDKQQKGALPAHQNLQQMKTPSVHDNDANQLVGMTSSVVCIQEKQSCTQIPLTSCRAGPPVTSTFQHPGTLHAGATQAFPERPVPRSHPVMKKLRSWLLQLPSLKHGYDLSLIKRDFLEATGMVLDPPALGYSKVKDIVRIFPEDFHVETPRHGFSLLFINDKNVTAMHSNVGSNQHNPGGQNIKNVVGLAKPLQASVKSKPASMQWKELHSSARTVDEKTNSPRNDQIGSCC